MSALVRQGSCASRGKGKRASEQARRLHGMKDSEREEGGVECLVAGRQAGRREARATRQPSVA